MGGRVKRDESSSASSPPLAHIQDKYAGKAIEPPAENIAALSKVKETEQQVQSNLQDKPQQVKGLVDEAFRSSIAVTTLSSVSQRSDCMPWWRRPVRAVNWRYVR